MTCQRCLVLWTPYLLLVGVCFYAMAQLPFPMSLAFEAWRYHALLLFLVAWLLWRTWIHWSDRAGKKSLTAGTNPAPWWGFVAGGIAVIGLFALMAYFLHFQDP